MRINQAFWFLVPILWFAIITYFERVAACSLNWASEIDHCCCSQNGAQLLETFFDSCLCKVFGSKKDRLLALRSLFGILGFVEGFEG